MARIVMADDGIPFNGVTVESGPLGGAESAFIALAEGLARRGHEVIACTTMAAGVRHKGVDWRPITAGVPDAPDLYIANRGDRLIPLSPNARRAAFWIHNPARYLIKWRYLSKLWKRKPAIIFLGDYHATTYPAWAPGGKRYTIPYGVDDRFRTAPVPDLPPPPRAVFTSNPLRGLDWIISLWVTRIHPRVKNAELHIYSGPQTYGSAGAAKAEEMEKVLRIARNMAECGVVLRQPVPKDRLALELPNYRVFTYRGTVDETYCAAVAEAQASGVPAVLCDIGSMSERVESHVTGYVVPSDDEIAEDEFAKATIKLLTDDGAWRRMHAAALAQRRKRGWDEAAADFEQLLR